MPRSRHSPFTLRSSGITVSKSQRATWARGFRTSRSRFQRAGQSPDAPEAFLTLPNDRRSQLDVLRRTKKARSSALRHIVVIGIGGSNLGARAVAEAVDGLEEWKGGATPRFWWLDTVEGDQARACLRTLNGLRSPREFVVVIISKSGATPETVVNASVILGGLHKWSNKSLQIFSVTDLGTPLWDLSEKKGWERFAIPHGVGGRFSVFSPVGLVPLALGGLDIRTLCNGAAASFRACSSDAGTNPAIQSATALLAAARLCRIHDTFVFRPQLASLAQWYRQLQGESLGKKFAGKRSGWMTPTTSVGSQDLHSVLQHYLTGPRDRVTSFLFAKASSHTIPKSDVHRLLPTLKNIGEDEVQAMLLSSVRRTYTAARLPSLSIELTKMNEESVGAFMQWKMMETVLIASALHINAYTQPAVEGYKKISRRLLTQV